MMRFVRVTRSIGRILLVASLVTSISVASAAPVFAAPLPSLDTTFPKNVACRFPLRVQGTGGDQVETSFAGLNGDVIKFKTGTGQNLIFTNVSNGHRIALPSRFSSTTSITHPNGSIDVSLVGSNVLILFPTDIPKGPSTTLHEGIVVYHDDGAGNFNVNKALTHSRTTDICAAVR